MAATDIRDITSFKWATVVGVNPISIKLDGDSLALALIPDSLVDPLSLFVGSRVRVELSLRKCVIHGVADGGIPAGVIQALAAANTPSGWLLCQGQSLLRAEYPRLFAAIGTAFGAANSSSFSLPALQGRVIVGANTAETEFNTRGKTGGEKSVVLSVAQIPTTVPYIMTPAAGAYYWNGNTGQGDRANPGGGQGHNNLQPYMALNYIIKI